MTLLDVSWRPSPVVFFFFFTVLYESVGLVPLVGEKGMGLLGRLGRPGKKGVSEGGSVTEAEVWGDS